MGRRPYRVEVIYTRGKPYHYLVKDVKYKDKRTKVKVYLSSEEPTQQQLEKYRTQHAYTLEARAAEKKAKIASESYSSKYLNREDLQTIETIHYYYKTFTDLLTTSEIDSYERNFEIAYVHGTTSIEGNTLTSKQTFDLLVNNILPNDKSLREINEVQNFRKVKNYREKYHGKLSLEFIKNLHGLIMDNIDTDAAGLFRRIDDVCISGCDIPVTPAILIVEELTKLINGYNKQIGSGVHPFEAAVLFHYHFELIHPFTDGNGRVGREIFNFMLRRAGYPRLLFLGEDRNLYILSLQLGNQRKFAQMIKIFSDLVTKQRLHLLIENLQQITTPPKDYRQLRIDQPRFYL
jgi:fido (protein-threonine AMPylation protein)